MKIEQSHINQIKVSFKKMQTKEDLLQLMNEVKPLIYGKKTVPFQLNQITWYANSKLAKKRYTQFTIKKKSGAERTINAPVEGLKSIQKVLSVILQCVFEPHKAAMGFVKDKSIVDNAKLHIGQKYVYNIDLKDFFPSVDQARVWKCFQLHPFNLIDNSEKVFKSDDNSVKLGYKILNVPSNTKEEKILFIFYNNILLKKGSYFLKLKAGGGIPYTVIIDSDNPLNGKIRINVSKTNLIPIKEIAKVSIEDSIEKNNDRIVQTILSLIEYHYYKKIVKDNRGNIANIIASICCTEMEVERKNNAGEWFNEKRNVLPQGAPTSPILTNVICQRLDYLLTAVARRFGLNYSRYADDITFSSMHNVYQPESDFIKELHRIIKDQGFHIKESKTRLQKEGYRKEVTGLLVNDKVNVQKRYIKQLRMWLYYWENYGYERAQNFFLQQYFTDKGNIVKSKPDMVNVIDGKLNYLKMVKGGENELYLKLRDRFNRLTSKYSFIEKVINVWKNEGLETAMDLYYLNSDIVQEKCVENFESNVNADDHDLEDLINNLIYGPPPPNY
jgi:hypothetical protein